ncbi:MAG: VanW family protein [Eubacteriales bacterium]|nr:VanW family protein [Eubacteriales bacterium]
MKRIIMLILLFVLCLPAFSAQGLVARYHAEATLAFHLRESPKESGKRITLIAKGNEVIVSEYGDDWSKIIINRRAGYAKSKWLSKFVALDPFTDPVPGYQRQIGIAKINTPVSVSVAEYSGNMLSPGDIVAVRSFTSEHALVNMMREVTRLPKDSLSFEAFVPWQNALPGDLLSGFTTFFNDETGGRLAANRAFNIELAARRIQAATIQYQESFSFNRLCGPYKKSNGYLMAPNISGDGKGYGGGVCQLSTTLYNASLGLPLRIDQWSVHRERGVAYIPQYFDAAVGSYSDLAFTNLLPYAISLEVLPQNGALTVLIRRADEMS